MTTEQILNIKKDRLLKMESNGRNAKSMGVIKKLRREIRSLEQ